jgi:hypothetical protein
LGGASRCARRETAGDPRTKTAKAANTSLIGI